VTLHHACTAFVDEEDCVGVCDLPEWVAVQDLIDAASDAICILSGTLISGRCQITVRPRNDAAWCGTVRYLGDGIRLPGYDPEPINVKVDGITLTAGTDYRMVDGALYRVEGYWPGSQNVMTASTEVGTFEITYAFGMEPPLYAKMACIELVKEAAIDLNGERSRLPDGTVSATLDGLNIDIDPRSGDLGLSALNRLMSVFAPDSPRGTAVWSPELMDGWVLSQVS
jgi:hypothetical protein